MGAAQSGEGHFRALVEQASTAMALFDRDLNVLAASGPWVSIHAGADEGGAALPHTLDAWREAFRRGLRGETVHGGDREAVDARWSVQPWHDERGAVGGILTMLGAAQGGAEASDDEAQRTRERLRLQALVFQNAQEGIVVTNERCEIVEANPAFERITEYSLDEIRGRHMRFIRSGRHDLRFYQSMWDAILPHGRWQGEIWNRRKSGEIYLEWICINGVHDEAGRIVNFVGTSIDLSRINHARSELERLAHHDALTGMPNRLLMMSRLTHAIDRAQRNRDHGALLFVDLDGFKAVNDRHGHAVGDQLLKDVAKRLRSRLRDVDTVARLGGDEFVVVLEDVAAPRDAATVAQAIIDHLAQPFALPAADAVAIGASVGIALFPGDGIDPALIVQRADEALCQAKNAGRGTFRFF